MNIRIEKTDITNTGVIDFLAYESFYLYLELNSKIKKLYDGDYKELIETTYIKNYKDYVDKDSIIYSAYFNDDVVGAGYIDKDNYLDSLFVKEEFRDKGIGSSILKSLIKECSKLGVIRVDVRIDAISLYERFNFHYVDGERNAAYVPMELGEMKNGK